MLDTVFDFLARMDGWDLLYYFWPFFVFDLTRYVLMDVLLVPWFLIRRRRERPARLRARRELFQERPLISVIAPGKNEGRHIPKLVISLSQQTYRHIEIIIVDDGSNDDTPDICRRLQRERKITRFIRNKIRGGKASAANTALRFTKGKYIVHLDADSHLANDAIEQILLPFYMDSNVGAVGGDVRVRNVTRSFATHLQSIEYMKSLSTGRTVSSMLGILRIIAGAFGAFRSDILGRVGGWDVGPGLDGDLTMKVRKMGFKVVHEPFAACYTQVPDTFLKLARQRYRWDRSMVRFRMRKHRDVLLPSASFRLRNFMASFENLFFNFVLNLKWWVYLLQMLIFHPHLLPIVFTINYVLYTVSNVLEYIVATVLYGHSLRRVEVRLMAFLPLMPIYTGLYLRAVRSFAYLMELLHKASYHDKWNPWKVSSIARREKL